MLAQQLCATIPSNMDVFETSIFIFEKNFQFFPDIYFLLYLRTNLGKNIADFLFALIAFWCTQCWHSHGEVIFGDFVKLVSSRIK
jgi:hypothetical protein